jgi:hypothetical protein
MQQHRSFTAPHRTVAAPHGPILHGALCGLADAAAPHTAPRLRPQSPEAMTRSKDMWLERRDTVIMQADSVVEVTAACGVPSCRLPRTG